MTSSTKPDLDDDSLAADDEGDDDDAEGALDDLPDDDLDDELDLDELHDRRASASVGADRERGGFASKMLGDLARRALTTGIGAVFMSEESLRSQMRDMKLPKEAMNYVVGQADKTKREIVAAIARETREFLSKLEVDKVLARALVGTTVEIQTRIKILPKEDGGVATQVEKSTTQVETPRRARKRAKKEADAAAAAAAAAAASAQASTDDDDKP